MKPIQHNHQNPLLENFEALDSIVPDVPYFGYIYLWYCEPEDMFYLGKHVGTVRDGYDGSGTMFKKVLRHYGNCCCCLASSSSLLIAAMTTIRTAVTLM